MASEQYEAFQEAAEKVNYGPHEKEPFVLMLPPGADSKAHPAFEVDKQGRAWFYLIPRARHGHRIVNCGEWCVVAAAAIAHYWREHADVISTDNEIVGMWAKGLSDEEFSARRLRWWNACDQLDAWSAIAAGSDVYNNYKIVEYKNV